MIILDTDIIPFIYIGHFQYSPSLWFSGLALISAKACGINGIAVLRSSISALAAASIKEKELVVIKYNNYYSISEY